MKLETLSKENTISNYPFFFPSKQEQSMFYFQNDHVLTLFFISHRPSLLSKQILKLFLVYSKTHFICCTYMYD